MPNAFEVEETVPQEKKKKKPIKISLSIILLSDYIYIDALGTKALNRGKSRLKAYGETLFWGTKRTGGLCAPLSAS